MANGYGELSWPNWAEHQGMGSRRKARELAVQVLFSMEFDRDDSGIVFDRVCENFLGKKTSIPFARDLVLGVCEKRPEIDQLIRGSSRNWRLERISRIDRSILRTAVFEILFCDDIPPKVSIDEAVELGKQFGNTDSAGFINGLLDNIYKGLKQTAATP
ncbi:MAG: transcription antitermination factor NusB [Desulfatiglandaceae bacterium]|jgi:transcription antitermination factor NusB